MSNYRPNSLLPSIAKIFESVIHDQIYEYFNNFNIFAVQQFDFPQKTLHRYAGINRIDHVSKQMENGKTPGNLYIDLSKLWAHKHLHLTVQV